jgi:hypothetical protein
VEGHSSVLSTNKKSNYYVRYSVCYSLSVLGSTVVGDTSLMTLPLLPVLSLPFVKYFFFRQDHNFFGILSVSEELCTPTNKLFDNRTPLIRSC